MKTHKFSTQGGPLRKKSFRMANRTVKLYQYLIEEKKEYIMSKQLLKAGTNPGAMVRESENAESDKDFIHKLSVAQKETGETQFWLELLYQNDYLTRSEFESIYSDTTEVMRLLRSSIMTKKQKLGLLSISIFAILGTLGYVYLANS
ncbi:MAG: four helix bundle protein [Bacteroidota bacterium]